MGQLLDSDVDDVAEASVMTFEISSLMELGEKNVLPVLLYLFRRIDKMARGQPGLLMIDEAWVVLSNPVFRERLRKWLKQKRKENWAVGIATQSLSDAASSKILDVLIESCPTKIFLPNRSADQKGPPGMPGPYEFYAAFGLNDQEVSIIKHATPKRHYYISSPDGKRLIDLALGPIALAFMAVSDKEKVARVKQLIAIHGDNWPGEWLNEQGIPYEQYLA